ncbi:MAG TPA: DUF4249 domain-containing protein [Ignavibacteria bacterium]
MKKLLIVLAFFLFIAGCITEFIPNIKNSNNEYIIIDAKITDKEGALVKLSTLQGGKYLNQPLGIDANVEISDNTGGKIVLTKTSQGVYSSIINGIPGRSYTLSVKTADGNEFTSSSEMMDPVIPIDSVYGVFEFRPSVNLKVNSPGVALYIDINNSTNNNKFFRWTYDETWLQKSPIRWMAYGTWDLKGNLLKISFWPNNTPNNIKCFHYSTSNQILIKSTDQLKPGFLKENPLYFTDDLSGRFSIGYSVEIKQYSITPGAFLYFNQLEKSDELTGSLYDPIPSYIPSNIYNTKDASQKVSGFFVVSSVVKKRIFINPTDIVPGGYMAGSSTSTCLDSTASSYSGAAAIRRNSHLEIYDFIPASAMTSMAIKMANVTCFDCVSNGGSIQKPSYWDDRYSGN